MENHLRKIANNFVDLGQCVKVRQERKQSRHSPWFHNLFSFIFDDQSFFTSKFFNVYNNKQETKCCSKVLDEEHTEKHQTTEKYKLRRRQKSV